MKEININKQHGCVITTFPDGQKHININDINADDNVKVTCSIRNADELLLLLQCSNALDNLLANKKILIIPYLMAARYDRLMVHGDSFDLKVVASLINMCGFERVYLYDVHSDCSTALINNSVNKTNDELVKIYDIPNSILICPDAGAAKKVSKYLQLNHNIKDIVYCNKTRDLTTGNITLTVLQPDKCLGKNCIIIDDLCDGGGTFIAIASQIKPAYTTLIVTHGIFSKGIDIFKGYIDRIITSDSYGNQSHELLTQINFK